MAETLRLPELRIVAMVFRNIWYRRNKLLFEQCFSSPKEVYEKSLMQIDEFLEANRVTTNSEPRPNTSNRRDGRKWVKPDEQWLKAYWDAATHTHSNSSGLGGIIRDAEGESHIVFCSYQSRSLIPEVVEATALRRFMHICKDLNLERVIFE